MAFINVPQADNCRLEMSWLTVALPNLDMSIVRFVYWAEREIRSAKTENVLFGRISKALYGLGQPYTLKVG